MSSSDSYQSLVDLNKPNAIECPICLEECNDDDKTCKKVKNKVFKCKHAVCRDCYNRLKQQKPYKCPVCRKEYSKSSMDPVMVNALSFTLSGLSV